MKYELIATRTENKKETKVYRNTSTGTEVKIQHIYTDKEGRKWYGFTDLYKVPMIRTALARHILDLYTIGLSLKDIQTWCSQEKDLINGDDPEKMQKLYALILEKERLATFTADPIKQHLALATVYVIEEDERIDYFDESISEKKLQLWNVEPEMIAFFLSWQAGHTQRYLKAFGKISQTVSKLEQWEADLKAQ